MTKIQVALSLAVYFLLVLSPVALLWAGGAPPGSGFGHDVAMVLGYEAIAIMGVQFLLTARFRRASMPFGIDIIYYFHRLMALLGLALIVGHVVVLFVAKPAWLSRIASGDVPAHLFIAAASLVLFAILIGASVWRKRLAIRYEPWRRWHGGLAVAALLLAVLHAELSGYYIQAPWKRAVWTVASLAWVLLLIYIRAIKPSRLLRRPYVVKGVRAERGDSWTVTVAPEGHAGLRFLPGQFAWLTLGGSPFTLNEHPFSIASSAAHPGQVSFTIKELGDFTRTVRDIAPGTRSYLDGAFGAFTCDFFPHAPGYVFVAGGIGIAPMMGMLRTLADRGERRPLLLLYGSSIWERVILREEIEALRPRLALEVVYVLQEPTSGWQGESGMLTPDLVARHIGSAHHEHEFFVCGPTAMIASVEKSLHGLGVPMRRIHSELFDLV